MKTPLLQIACVAVLLLVGCGPKKTNDTSSSVGTTETTQDVVAETVVADANDLSGYDMVMFNDGKLFFYNTTTSAMLPYTAESDSVVNGVFTPDDMLYYCVAAKPRILLKRIDLNQREPKPEELADWGVTYESCVTETYETVSPLVYYAGRNMLGLWHEFSWDSYSLTQQRLYNLSTGEITDWDWEAWEKEEQDMMQSADEQEEDYHFERVEDEIREFLVTNDSNYYFMDGLSEACLSDKIDFNKYISDPDYATEIEFEYVSSSPDNLKVLYMAILEWGDFPHGILCIASLDGHVQIPLEDTDCTGYIAQWLDDGSLVYVGEKPLSPEEQADDVSWHYTDHCIKRVYPDGYTEIISDCVDFLVRR